MTFLYYNKLLVILLLITTTYLLSSTCLTSFLFICLYLRLYLRIYVCIYLLPSLPTHPPVRLSIYYVPTYVFIFCSLQCACLVFFLTCATSLLNIIVYLPNYSFLLTSKVNVGKFLNHSYVLKETLRSKKDHSRKNEGSQCKQLKWYNWYYRKK